eukprot:5281227-Prorocentrum_lima.AAC.1
MTSSLVGSEMCIRDRVWDVIDLIHMVVESCIMETGDYGPVWQVKLHFPVSYTHLTLPTICSV